jgi:hypothetical protein
VGTAHRPRRGQRALAGAHHLGLAAGAHGRQVDHRGGRQRAGARVDHAGQVVFEPVPDVLRVVERVGFVGQDQRGGQQRGVVQVQQGLQGLVLGHAQADGLARGVAHAARHLLAGFEDEGVGAGRGELEQAVLRLSTLA